MDLQDRVEHLKRLRDELRRQLRSGEGNQAQLRVRMIELAQEISDLEAEPRKEEP